MLGLQDLDPDQIEAVNRLYDYDGTLLVAPTGGGKTIITLTAVSELLRDGAINKVLIIAPLKVAVNVWRGEHLLWQHTKHLKVGIAAGDDFDSVLANADQYQIIVCNFDMVPKLAAMDSVMKQFDGFVCDEGSKMARGGVWFKRLRRHIKNFTWRLVCSATPITEGWERLFYQCFLVDNGEAFGKNKQKFLDTYFYPLDHARRRWGVIPTYDEKITAQVAHLVHVVPDYKHTLPPFTVEQVACPPPPIGWKHYKEMAGKFETAGVTAKNAGAKAGKLQQLASGFVYTDEKKAIRIHDVKFQAVDRILNSKLPNICMSNKIVVYQFIDQLDRLREMYPDLVTLADNDHVVDDWNAGKIPLLAMHCLSGAHGLNMARGGNILIWTAPVFSLDQFSQMNERLWRRGQTKPVTAYVLVAHDTVDDLALLRHADKSAFVPAFKAHLAKMTS